MQLRIQRPSITQVALEATNVCNLRCGICFSHSSPRPKGFMSMELYKRLVDEIDTIDTITHVALCYGGESFIHPRFNEMLSYLRPNRKYHTMISTNGTLLTESLMRSVIDANIDRLHVSLDGSGEEHEKRRVGSNYETVKKNVLALTEMKGGREYLPMISVNLVIDQDHTIDQINDFISEWINLVNLVTIDTVVNEHNQFTCLDNCPNEMKTELPHPLCPLLFIYMAVMWNGDVIPCCNDLEGKLVFGNVTNSTILKEFNNPSITRMREQFILNTFPDGHLCKTCEMSHRRVTKHFTNMLEEKENSPG